MSSNKTSHPMWVRGLKLVQNICENFAFLVAPHVGAWIETVQNCL